MLNMVGKIECFEEVIFDQKLKRLGVILAEI